MRIFTDNPFCWGLCLGAMLMAAAFSLIMDKGVATARVDSLATALKVGNVVDAVEASGGKAGVVIVVDKAGGVSLMALEGGGE